ncbi:hypothetical protein M758_UG313200 [Ceratodon purpureus]|nr:hypothetical protein M758_UG313200 [Ceratodon purpureus]
MKDCNWEKSQTWVVLKRLQVTVSKGTLCKFDLGFKLGIPPCGVQYPHRFQHQASFQKIIRWACLVKRSISFLGFVAEAATVRSPLCKFEY